MDSQIIKDRDELRKLVEAYEEDMGHGDYLPDKHRLVWESLGTEYSLRLPYDLKVDKDANVDWDRTFEYIMLVVQTGMATVGMFNGQELLSHKVYGAYMVRKKQGVSQIKHLKTKGKSRAGSRIRLASGLEFFEEINTRLQRHFKEHDIERIIFSCSKILMPHFFGSKVAVPFDKKDDRILGIPRHIEKPTHEEMMRAHRFLCYAELNKKEVYL